MTHRILLGVAILSLIWLSTMKCIAASSSTVNHAAIGKSELQNSSDIKLNQIEKEILDIKSRDISIRDKIQQEQKEFYSGAMSYFSTSLNLAAIILTIVIVAGGFVGIYNLSEIKKDYRNKEKELKELEINVKSAQNDWQNLKDEIQKTNSVIEKNNINVEKMLSNFESEAKHRLEHVDNQGKALMEFMLGVDVITNPEADQQSIKDIAIPYFKKCVKLWPKFELATIYFAIAHKQIGDFKSSYKELLKMYDDNELSTPGVTHLLESAIFMNDGIAINAIEQSHGHDLVEYGNRRFMPFMQALKNFTTNDIDKMTSIIESEKKIVNELSAGGQKRKQMGWSFSPAKQFLEKHRNKEGYDKMMEYIELLEGRIS